MPLYIMYFNLKDSVIEEEFARKAKEWVRYIQGKIEGLGITEVLELKKKGFSDSGQCSIFQHY